MIKLKFEYRCCNRAGSADRGTQRQLRAAIQGRCKGGVAVGGGRGAPARAL